MKKILQPKFLPLFALAGSVLGLILRIIAIIPGPDQDGLYASRPVTWVLIWLVTALTLAGIFYLSSLLNTPGRYFDNFPKSILGAVGCGAAAFAVLLSGIGTLLSAFTPQPGAMLSIPLLSILTGLLGIAGAVGLAVTAVCRLTGKKCHFIAHALPCLYFALRVFDCCRLWSNETQIGVFLFQFLASVCIMLAAYQLCCYDVNLGNRKSSLFWSLAGIYFCVLTLPMGEDLIFYVGMGLWLATNLCSTRPLKAKAPENAEVVEPDQATESVCAEEPSAEPPVSEPLPSYQEVLSQLEQE